MQIKAEFALMDWAELIPLLGVLGAALALWLAIGRNGGTRPPPPAVVSSPSEAQTADRQARADSLEEAVDAVGPHTDEVDSDEPTDSDVDDWIEAKD